MTSLHIAWHCVCGDAESSHYTQEDGEMCYGWCRDTERDCAGRGYRPINHTRRPASFTAMLLAIGEDGNHPHWPAHYTCDLSTDYQTIIRDLDDGDAFIWIVREMGTHLYPLKWIPDDKNGFVRQAMVYHARENTDALVYVWNGTDKLSRITYDMAREIVRNAAAGHVRVSEPVAS